MTNIKNPTRKTKLRWACGLALGGTSLALMLVAATGCHHKEATAGEEKSRTLEVGTTNPVRKKLTREVVQPGWLRPYELTPIYTKIAGFAFEPKCDIGDHMKKDDLLVQLDVPEVEQELRLKKAKVKQAEADLKQAEALVKAAAAGVKAAEADVSAKRAAIRSAAATVERWTEEDKRAKAMVKLKVFDEQQASEVFKEFLVSEAKKEEAIANYASAGAYKDKADAYLDKTNADVDVAKASLLSAEADRDQKKDWLDYKYIKAPFNCLVTVRNVHTGHFLQPSNSGSTSKAAEPLFVIMRTEIMRCVLDIPEVDAAVVNDGDKAVIRFDAMPGVETIGVVQRNAGALDERTRTLKAEVWLKPNGATIRYTTAPRGKNPEKPNDPTDCAVSAIDPTPPKGGSNYPRNATFPLLIAGGRGGIVNATTNADGVVTSYSLNSPGKHYPLAKNVEVETISEIYKPFMFAHVTIFGTIDNAWTLPPDAILTDILNNGGRPYCFVVEDGKARKLILQTGPVCNEGVQVLRKQRPGTTIWEPFTGKEIVITTNTKALQDGQEVRGKAVEVAP